MRIAFTVLDIDVGGMMSVEQKGVCLIQKSIIRLKNNYHKNQGGAEVWIFYLTGDIDPHSITVAPALIAGTAVLPAPVVCGNTTATSIDQ